MRSTPTIHGQGRVTIDDDAAPRGAWLLLGLAALAVEYLYRYLLLVAALAGGVVAFLVYTGRF